MQWIDSTLANSDNPNRIPNRWSAQCGPMSMTVENRGAEWIGRASCILPFRVLRATTREQAQAEVVEIVRAWVDPVATALAADE